MKTLDEKILAKQEKLDKLKKILTAKKKKQQEETRKLSNLEKKSKEKCYGSLDRMLAQAGIDFRKIDQELLIQLILENRTSLIGDEESL